MAAAPRTTRLRIDRNGKIVSREVLEDVYPPTTISGIEQTAEGTIYLGGNTHGMFVTRGPE